MNRPTHIEGFKTASEIIEESPLIQDRLIGEFPKEDLESKINKLGDTIYRRMDELSRYQKALQRIRSLDPKNARVAIEIAKEALCPSE